MNIELLNTLDNELTVKLRGEMDAQGCAKIRSELENICLKTQPQITLDIKQVSFIDSSGIGAIVFLFKRLKQQNRSMKIIGVQGQPQQLMTLLRIDAAIPLHISNSEMETMQCAH